MAILKGEATFNIKQLNDLARQFPSIGGGLLAKFGKRGRVALKEEFLSGQELTLRMAPRDKLGRYTISSDVNKNRTAVKIYSYPVNLFEKGRILRSGKKEAPKRIIGTKLKQVIASRAGQYVSEYENEILNPELRKAGF